jgi:hypothetical protein
MVHIISNRYPDICYKYNVYNCIFKRDINNINVVENAKLKAVARESVASILPEG